jgi:serine/threonine protein kinase
MTSPNLYQLAKKGDPNAIAIYLNERLSDRNLKTQAKRNDECLVLAIAFEIVGDRETIVDAVRRELIELESRSITKVQMGARQIGQKDLAWQAEFDLDYPKPLPSLDLSFDEEEAKDGLHGVGDVIRDRYRILEILGQGGNGITYAATDLQQNKKVAVKALSLRHMNDWKQIELFEREAKVLSQLDHVAIPKYFDFFTIDTEEDRAFYIVQELALGQNLAKLIEAGWRTNEKGVKKIAEQVLNILIYLHGLNPSVIHRDIKPHNLIYGDDGKVSLVDFGAVQDTYRSTMARGSTVIGTFGYMAPEQFRGQAVSATDLFSLGATILFILTHRSPSELPQERLRYDFRSKIKVSEQFADWLQKMVEPDLGDRFTSASESLAALQKKQIVWFPRRRLSWQAWVAIVSIGSSLTAFIVTNKWMILGFYDIYPEICSRYGYRDISKNQNHADIQELIDYINQNQNLPNKLPYDSKIGVCISGNIDRESLNILHQRGIKLDYVRLFYSNPKEVFDWVISTNVDINTRSDKDESTILHSALNHVVRRDQKTEEKTDIAKSLIERGADINIRNKMGQTPLYYAIRGDNTDIAKSLIEKGADINNRDQMGQTPLYYAINEGNTIIVIILIEKGADINIRDSIGRTPLDIAMLNDNITSRVYLVNLLIKKDADINIVKNLIEKDAKNNDNEIPRYLFSALDSMDSNWVKFLIKKGANVNLKDKNGDTFLDIAYNGGFKDSIKNHFGYKKRKFLIENGLDMKKIEDEYAQIYLSEAIYARDLKVIEFLIKKDANINAKNDRGDTSLHYASYNGDLTIVKLLVDNNADINAVNNDGKTPLSFAQNDGVARFLINKGAKK